MTIFHLHRSREDKRQKIHDKIIKTHAAIEDYPDGFLNPWKLLALKIEVSQVSVSTKGTIMFRPRFFLPLSPQSVRTYLSTDPSIKTGLDEGKPEYMGCPASRISIVSVARCPFILDLCRDKFATAVQKGFCLDNLTGLRECGATNKGKWKHQPNFELIDGQPSTDGWQILRILEDVEHEVPHVVFDLRQNIDVDKVKWLTVGELKAILRVMAVRMELDCYRQHLVMPVSRSHALSVSGFRSSTLTAAQVLVVSYLNSAHGRILQAHHDGKRVVIQHTKVLDFEGLKHQPVELFLRYYGSQPIGKTAKI
ncbi:hypothetical protein BO94DRAFT_510432 [Aspergillus sclerotioniger CBS 115572]|uniref:Uncharacterized protein n=1 Tax=Aspergillus sclerotioniger CBS 115572 TaxID=1450535 RepID=A0A317X7L5_9EURO|nr:hypothetical protein BO94DRAFT_510432 [Aspergillus sclerotioniger CBS 115572]PWY94191.1 hypothetical protein BO94DRAFT_510432 [Aspergillus sclerotioniger CBS 115572]